MKIVLEVSEVKLEEIKSVDQIKNISSAIANPEKVFDHCGNSYEDTQKFFNKLFFGNLER